MTVANTSNQKMSGLYTALITPRNKDGSINYKVYESLFDYGAPYVDGFVVLGSTGEPSAFNQYDKEKLIEMGVGKGKDLGKDIVIGASGESINAVKKEYRTALKYKATKVLTMPLLGAKQNRPGLVYYYQTLADHGLGIIVYDNKSRCGQGLTVDDMAEIAKIENIISLKAASGDIELITEMIDLLAGTDISVLSGDDGKIFEIMSRGGVGAISVLSNAYPELFGKLVKLLKNKEFVRANSLNDEIRNLYRAASVAGNPTSIMSIINDILKIPVGMVSPEMGHITPAKFTEILKLFKSESNLKLQNVRAIKGWREIYK